MSYMGVKGKEDPRQKLQESVKDRWRYKVVKKIMCVDAEKWFYVIFVCTYTEKEA